MGEEERERENKERKLAAYVCVFVVLPLAAGPWLVSLDRAVALLWPLRAFANSARRWPGGVKQGTLLNQSR